VNTGHWTTMQCTACVLWKRHGVPDDRTNCSLHCSLCIQWSFDLDVGYVPCTVPAFRAFGFPTPLTYTTNRAP